MTKVVELALERIGDLWPEWSKSRHKKRKELFRAISLNIQIVLSCGSYEEKEYLFDFIEIVEDRLQKSLAKEFPPYKKKFLQKPDPSLGL
jgi:hypothetical protein